MPELTSDEGFLLLRTWRDSPGGLTLELWAAADPLPLHITLTGQEAVMFVEQGVPSRAARRQPLELRTLSGAPVDALYFRSQKELVRERTRLRGEGASPQESDIKPVERFLMERFVTGSFCVSGPSYEVGGIRHYENPKVSQSESAPTLRVLSLDIETDGFDGPLLSIAGATESEGRVFSREADGDGEFKCRRGCDS